MSYGYSLKTIEANREADDGYLGVQLGRKCIAHGIPVSKVADDLGATRQSVYNWFCGVSAPQGEFIGLIRKYIANLSS
jgi:hypothetical protein